MKTELLKKSIRNIPNFPIQGIQFKDITTLFQNNTNLKLLASELSSIYRDKGITKVIGIESRGFFMGPVMAVNLNAGFVPIRKPGKLPGETYEEKYTKEYGVDSIQIHKDALCKNDIVVIHDDLLATGGTMNAAYKLIKKIGVKEIYINFIIELEELEGRKLFPDTVQIDSLIKFPV